MSDREKRVYHQHTRRTICFNRVLIGELHIFPTAGMPGDSNTKCHNFSSLLSGTVKTVGSQCTTNKDCMYNLCAENVCSAPPLTCPTSIPGVRHREGLSQDDVCIMKVDKLQQKGSP